MACTGPFCHGQGGFCECNCNCCPPDYCEEVTANFKCGTPIEDYVAGCDCDTPDIPTEDTCCETMPATLYATIFAECPCFNGIDITLINTTGNNYISGGGGGTRFCGPYRIEIGAYCEDGIWNFVITCGFSGGSLASTINLEITNGQQISCDPFVAYLSGTFIALSEELDCCFEYSPMAVTIVITE